MKIPTSQLTLFHAFSTGRQYSQMMDEIGREIDKTAFDIGWQRRFAKVLNQGNEANKDGAKGYDLILIIRVILFRCVTGKHYREIAGLMHDSKSLRRFLELEQVREEDIPCYQTIQRWVNAVPVQMYEALNQSIVKKKRGEGMELKHWRTDATCVESNIHYPTDSSLLNDSLRWLHRWIKRIREAGVKVRMNETEICFEKGRKIYLEIVRYTRGKGKQNQQRKKKLYRQLIHRTKRVIEHFQRHLNKAIEVGLLDDVEHPGEFARWQGMIGEWERLEPLMVQAMEQARRRVLREEKIKSEDKLLSLWEEHTQVILRGKAAHPVEFGHKITLYESEEGMNLVGGIYEKVRQEGSVLEEEIEKITKIVPIKSLTADRAYWSKEREKELKGIILCIPCKGKKDSLRKAYESRKGFKKGQRFRVGIEGTLSVLIRRHKLRRSYLKQWGGFQRHVHMCVIGMNLLRSVDWIKRKERIEEERLQKFQRLAA